MPSDHAVMFFALASCIFVVWRSAGIFLFLHAALLVCAARVLFGYHYLSDVVAGAIVGTLIAFLLMPVLTRLLQKLRERPNWIIRPELEYPLLFLVTFQFATMFDAVRDLAGRAARFLF